jgi:hypothetical protein
MVLMRMMVLGGGHRGEGRESGGGYAGGRMFQEFPPSLAPITGVAMGWGGIGGMMLCFVHGEKRRISAHLKGLGTTFKALSEKKS